MGWNGSRMRQLTHTRGVTRAADGSVAEVEIPGPVARGGPRVGTVRILLQTTTPGAKDDWSIESLSLLRERLASMREDASRFRRHRA
jgi:hypothetical protein